MELHGKNVVGDKLSSRGNKTFNATNPATGELLGPVFVEATSSEVSEAMELASGAFTEASERRLSVVPLLRALADEILNLGADLIERATAETGLPEARFLGERARTVAQIQMFADLVEEGSWVDARIDSPIPDRQPIPKPDLRQMLVPVGPVVVFGASNFPLAFSVPGGDTASAVAAGNPVVVKAHPAHPGTSELVAKAFRRALAKTDLPSGFFSMLQGSGHEVGLEMVRHPRAEAVGFTGSLQGGRALFNEAAARPRPIPVYAEMGSINPVFILSSALRERPEALGRALFESLTLGVGQFCTNPGLVVALKGPELERLMGTLQEHISESQPATMLHGGIRDAYETGIEKMCQVEGVRLVCESAAPADPEKTEVSARVLTTDAETFRKKKNLSEEVFGPSTLVVVCENFDEVHSIAENLEGHLTATVHGTPEDLIRHRRLVSTLESKVGRLIFNGVPTGVEVCSAMHHGGPYPATTAAYATSVGTNAIRRFARPVCFQDFPDDALPVELRNANSRGIWRLVDGQLRRGSI